MSVTNESQSERIRAKMALLRVHMHKDARRIVANTNSLLDWKDYVIQFPKAIVAAGLLTGFVLVPGRKVMSTVKLSQGSLDELMAQRQQLSGGKIPHSSEVASGALRMLTGLAMSGAAILVRKGVEHYFNNPSKTGTNPIGNTFRSN